MSGDLVSTDALKKYVWDASALMALINSKEQGHEACYSFMKNQEQHVHIFPATAWFEYQAAQLRKEREGRKPYRELYLLDQKNILYLIDDLFIKKVDEHQLHLRFPKLRGGDLQ
jgi:hypothetical protein